MNFYTWDAQRTRHISLIVFFFSTWRNSELKSLLFILYFLHFLKDTWISKNGSCFFWLNYRANLFHLRETNKKWQILSLNPSLMLFWALEQFWHLRTFWFSFRQLVNLLPNFKKIWPLAFIFKHVQPFSHQKWLWQIFEGEVWSVM